MTSLRNKTIKLSSDEIDLYRQHLIKERDLFSLTIDPNNTNLIDSIINGDYLTVSEFIFKHTIDLAIIDCPYNLSKKYNSYTFEAVSDSAYKELFNRWINYLVPLLKPNATVYVCSEWKTSAIIQPILNKYFIVRNRITWERDKGRGSLVNYKNNSEDIFFCTLSNTYTFNVEDIKLKRKVIAPYRDTNNNPKDWQENINSDGTSENYRLTYPSNLWYDITVPYWSMPENGDHPTQKPEKLLAKLILASSNPGDLILDPFLGVGSSAVVAKKLDRRFIGIELDEHYSLVALKRLALAELDRNIQGYQDGAFLERNYKLK